MALYFIWQNIFRGLFLNFMSRKMTMKKVTLYLFCLDLFRNDSSKICYNISCYLTYIKLWWKWNKRKAINNKIFNFDLSTWANVAGGVKTGISSRWGAEVTKPYEVISGKWNPNFWDSTLSISSLIKHRWQALRFWPAWDIPYYF